MNINLIYQEKAFNFDLRTDTSVKYLEDLSSKLICKDKSTFTLVYKNNDLSKNPESLLKELINTEETNIPIEISLKNNTKPKIKKILPKIELSKEIKAHSKEKYHKGNILLNKTEIYNISNKGYSIKDLQEYSKQNYSSDKYRMKKNDKIIKNEVFEALYNNKENEILSLMNNLSQIIKEYDTILYKKQNNERKNKELLRFEKNVLEFKNNQIKLLQKLVNYFDKKESNYLKGNIDLDDFYLDLKFNFLDNDTKKKHKDKQFPLNSLNDRNKNQYNDNSYLLPILSKNIKINPKIKLFSPKEKLENNIKTIKTLKEKKEIDNSLFKSERKKIKDKNLNKSSCLFKIQENIQNKNYLGKNMIDNDESDNSKNENSTISKPQNIYHTIIPKNIINEINNDSNCVNSIIINKNNNSDEEDVENIEHIKKKLLKRQNNPIKYNKIDTLFEISESRNNDNEKDDSSQNNKSFLENSQKNDIFEVKKINSRKSVNGFLKNNRLGFIIRDKSRKATKRAKKLGANANDFLI